MAAHEDLHSEEERIRQLEGFSGGGCVAPHPSRAASASQHRSRPRRLTPATRSPPRPRRRREARRINAGAPGAPSARSSASRTRPPDAEPASAGDGAAVAPFRNREKVLITCSRRITYRYWHLMQNVLSLLPHTKKDSKVESQQSKGNALNELLELRSCSSCLFFEV